MQRGKIVRKGSSWLLRYKKFRIVDGRKVWSTTYKKIGDYDLRHRTQESVEGEAEKFLKKLPPARKGPGGVPSFQEQSEIWIERCKNRQRKPIKPATLKNWNSYLKVHILPALGQIPLHEITNKAVKDFVTDLSTRVSAKSVNNIVQVVKMVKASALDEDGNELYPTKWNHDFIDMPRIREREQHRPSFSAEQLQKLIKAGDRRAQMLIILLAATGLRAGEVFGLEVRHFDGASMKVEQEVWNGTIQAPKTENAHRTIELHPSVAKLLKTFIGNRTAGLIFSNGSAKPIHQSNFLRREFHPLLKSAGIPKAGFHGFRRYRNTYLRNVAGCPDGLLKFWLGHSANRDMSGLYDRIRDDQKFRQQQAKAMGVGFKVPARLAVEKPKAKSGDSTAR